MSGMNIHGTNQAQQAANTDESRGAQGAQQGQFGSHSVQLGQGNVRAQGALRRAFSHINLAVKNFFGMRVSPAKPQQITDTTTASQAVLSDLSRKTINNGDVIKSLVALQNNKGLGDGKELKESLRNLQSSQLLRLRSNLNSHPEFGKLGEVAKDGLKEMGGYSESAVDILEKQQIDRFKEIENSVSKLRDCVTRELASRGFDQTTNQAERTGARAPAGSLPSLKEQSANPTSLKQIVTLAAANGGNLLKAVDSLEKANEARWNAIAPEGLLSGDLSRQIQVDQLPDSSFSKFFDFPAAHTQYCTGLEAIKHKARENRDDTLKIRKELTNLPDWNDAGRKKEEVKRLTFSALATEKFNLGTALIALAKTTAHLDLMDHSRGNIENTSTTAKDHFEGLLAQAKPNYLKKLISNLNASDLVVGLNQQIAHTSCLADNLNSLLNLNDDNAIPDLDKGIDEGSRQDNLNNVEFATAPAIGVAILTHMSHAAQGIKQAATEVLLEKHANKLSDEEAQSYVMDLPDASIPEKFRALIAAKTVEDDGYIESSPQSLDVSAPPERRPLDDTMSRMKDFIIGHGGDVEKAVNDVEAGKTDADLVKLIDKDDPYITPDKKLVGNWSDYDDPDSLNAQLGKTDPNDVVNWEDVD